MMRIQESLRSSKVPANTHMRMNDWTGQRVVALYHSGAISAKKLQVAQYTCVLLMSLSIRHAAHVRVDGDT